MKLRRAVITLMAIASILAGCGRLNVQSSPGAIPPQVNLDQLIITLPELVEYGGSAFAAAHFTDPAQYPDFQPGMQNPWLLEGAEYDKWNWLAKRWQVAPDKLDGLLQVSLENAGFNFGYVVLRFKDLSQEDVDALLNFLTRQGKQRFKLFIARDMCIILWTNDHQPSLDALASWLKAKHGVAETPIDYVGWSQDLVPHIDTTINQEFDALTYPQRCLVDADCTGAPVPQTCLKCPGGVLVFHNLTCEVPAGITQPTGEQGLCWQTQNLGVSGGFYSGECISTLFCLLPFENQEVPTIYVAETQRFLPLWKQALLEKSGITPEYYRQHYYVHSVYVTEAGGRQELLVRYDFKIDWLTLLLDSTAAIRQGEAGSPYLDDSQIKEGFLFAFTRSVEAILSEQQVEQTLAQGCMAGMRYDPQRNIRIDQDRLILEAYAEVDTAANRCKMARLDLESGVIQCADIACAIP